MRKCAAASFYPMNARNERPDGRTKGTDDMTMMLDKDARDDLIERGYSRRQLAEVAALLGAGVAASTLLDKP